MKKKDLENLTQNSIKNELVSSLGRVSRLYPELFLFFFLPHELLGQGRRKTSELLLPPLVLFKIAPSSGRPKFLFLSRLSFLDFNRTCPARAQYPMKKG
jgi:hypothetical protein